MSWSLEEAAAYYQKQGAPVDQSALISLLREVQQESGGRIPRAALGVIAGYYDVKETFLQAVIKRIPTLKLSDVHCLELCGGPNCSKRAKLAAFVEKTYGSKPAQFELRYSPCMRMCGKGPNLRWDGTVYNRADEELIRRLVEQGR